ncbi:MAG: hypothetical protein ACR2IK_20375 [Chloroflexota bacterium]
MGTAHNPTLNDILVLASIVVLRTVLIISSAASCARPISASTPPVGRTSRPRTTGRTCRVSAARTPCSSTWMRPP